MANAFDREKILIGEEGLEKLTSAHVAVFGIGGVGSYTVEALARSGVGELTLIDKDIVEVTNINRQLIADETTIGKAKVEIAKDRIEKINPKCKVNALQIFYLPETADEIDFSKFDYVVDAVDTVTAKLSIIETADKNKVPVISSMGTGNKLDATAFIVGDLFETNGDGLAKVMRRECRARNIEKVKVVYSKETGIKSEKIGSVAFVPSVAGLIIAGEVVKDIVGVNHS